MNACELREQSTLRVRNAADTPCVKPLRRELEMRPHDVGADDIDQAVMGMEFRGHTPLYQRCVYISSPHTFIGIATALMQKLGVADDPAFGERLRRLIQLAGYKNPRRFAIDGMGWSEERGPQRLNSYLNKGRLPEVEVLVTMSEKLGVSLGELLGLGDASSSEDDGLRGILLHLLSLEGIPPDRADTIASASLAAQRLLKAFPDEEPLPTRAKYAARAAWIQQQNPAPGR